MKNFCSKAVQWADHLENLIRAGEIGIIASALTVWKNHITNKKLNGVLEIKWQK